MPMEEFERAVRRREDIAKEMLAIRSMLRGSITEQRLRSPKSKVLRGPYYVLSRNEGGKTRSRRLRPGEELDRARRDVEAHERFKGLCREFETLTERMGALEIADPEVKKKRRK